jgi:hypothetical protein
MARTTVTHDEDVAVRLARKREKAGLDGTSRREVPQTPPRTTGLALGPSLVGSLDNVAEVLARTEGEDHR